MDEVKKDGLIEEVDLEIFKEWASLPSKDYLSRSDIFELGFKLGASWGIKHIIEIKENGKR